MEDDKEMMEDDLKIMEEDLKIMKDVLKIMEDDLKIMEDDQKCSGLIKNLLEPALYRYCTSFFRFFEFFFEIFLKKKLPHLIT
jgi:hypothetical protein